MITRGMYTPREPAAGGDNSTPAPIQDYVLSSTHVPPTAANAEELTIFDVVAIRNRSVEAGCQGRHAEMSSCATLRAHVRTERATAKQGSATLLRVIAMLLRLGATL